MTIVLVGYVGVHTLYALGAGWSDLIDRADAATTFDALKDVGKGYAKVMGADNARILVMVATAAVGSGLGQLLKALPTLPGAGPASELAVAEGGVPFEQVGAVEAVTIGQGGLTISLATGAVPMFETGVKLGEADLPAVLEELRELERWLIANAPGSAALVQPRIERLVEVLGHLPPLQEGQAFIG